MKRDSKNTLPLKKIRIDGGTQPRARIDSEVVADYAARIEEGDSFPPVVVFHDGAENWLADGFHRYHARAAMGALDIEVDVRPGTQRDAILFGCGANIHHGLRRSNADKRKAVTTLLTDEEWSKYSDGKIAEICAVSQNFVSEIHRQLKSDLSSDDSAKKIGRDGKSRGEKKKPAASNGHKEPLESWKPTKADETETSAPEPPARKEPNLIGEMLTAVRADVEPSRAWPAPHRAVIAQGLRDLAEEWEAL